MGCRWYFRRRTRLLRGVGALPQRGNPWPSRRQRSHPASGREPGRRRAPRKGLLARLRPTARPRARVTGSHSATAPTASPRHHRPHHRPVAGAGKRARRARRPARHPTPRLPTYARSSGDVGGDAGRGAVPGLGVRVDRAAGARVRDPRTGRVRRAVGLLPLRQHVHAPRPGAWTHATAVGGAAAGRGGAGVGDDGLPDLPPGPADEPSALAHGGRQRLRRRPGAGPRRAAVHAARATRWCRPTSSTRVFEDNESATTPRRRHRGGPVGRPGPGQRAAARRRRRRRPRRRPHRLDDPGQHRHPHRRDGDVQPAAQHDERAVPRRTARCTTSTRTASPATATPRQLDAQRGLQAGARRSTPASSASATTRAPTRSSRRSRAAWACHVDYYLLVNLRASSRSSTRSAASPSTSTSRSPIGGNTDAGIPPTGYLQPGPDQHLDGFDALWFSRGRYGSDDYQRMDRAALHDRRDHRRGRPAEPAAQLPGPRRGGQGDRPHRHPAQAAAGVRRPRAGRSRTPR